MTSASLPRRLFFRRLAGAGLLALPFADAAKAAGALAGGDASQSEVERFCSNIADAARDKRYALQAEELQKLQGEIDTRMAALEKKRAELEEWVKRRDAFLEQAEDGVVKIYRAMKPDAAAERLAELRVELAAAILMKLEPKRAGTILNEMESRKAATLTAVMANIADRDNPT